MSGAEPKAELANQLPEIEGLIGPAEQAGEQGAARAAEEGIHDSDVEDVCTHYEYNCTLYGYNFKVPTAFEFGAQISVAGLRACWLTFQT